ncbi:hypothetical protein BaRGS_00040055 [Batillaria attramentaria]|uniref:Secreted protein n=1 Tax=Batillaria attramentaria TaxID=370345 RepID=A0ABD0J1L2_9CAEN
MGMVTVASTVPLLAGLVMAVFTVSASQTVNCNTVSFSMDLRSCFRIHDVTDVVVQEQSSIANTSIHVEGFLAEPHTVCQEREKYVNVFDCLSGATSKCFPRDKAAYFPNTTITADSINYLCQHVNTSESVMDCYIASYSKVYECAHKLADEELNKEQEEDIASTVCTFADITHDCIQVKVDCDDQARHTLLHFHDKYRTPPGCPSPSRQRRTYISTNGGVSLLLSQVSVVLITLLVSANFA